MKASLIAAVAALAVLAIGPTLLAEPPPSPSGAAPSAFEAQRRQLLERLRERQLLPSASALPSTWPAPSRSGALPLPSAGHVRQELARKWQLLAESRHSRRERHRAALVRELGQRLSDPQVKAELKLHATRVAELSRLRFLADNGRSGPAREQLLGRISKLAALEDQRHERRMAKLVGARPAPSGSARSAPAAPSSSAGAP